MSKFANLYPGAVKLDPILDGLSDDSASALFASSLLNQHPHIGSRGVPSFGSKVLQSEDLNFSFNIVQPIGKSLGLLYYYIFQVRSPPAIIQYVSSGITHVPEFSEAPLQVSAGSFGTSRAAHQAAMRHYSISLDMSSVTLFRGNELDIEEHRRVLEYFCRAHAVKTEQAALASLYADGSSTALIDLVVTLNETAPVMYKTAERFRLLKNLVMPYTTELLVKSMIDSTDKRIPTLSVQGQQDGVRFLHEMTTKWLSMISTSRKQSLTAGPRLVEVLPSSLINAVKTLRIPVEKPDISGLTPGVDPANTGMTLLGVKASQITDFNIRDPDNIPSQVNVFENDQSRALVVYEQQTAQMPTTFSTTTNMLPLIFTDTLHKAPGSAISEIKATSGSKQKIAIYCGDSGADSELQANALLYRTPLTSGETLLKWKPFLRGDNLQTVAIVGVGCDKPQNKAASEAQFADTVAFSNHLNATNDMSTAAAKAGTERYFPVRYSTFDKGTKRRKDWYHYMVIHPNKQSIDLVVLLKESYTSYPSFSTLPHCVVIATTPVMSDDTTTLWQTRLEASFFMATFVPDSRTVVQNRMPAYIAPRTNNNPCKQSFTVAYLVSTPREQWKNGNEAVVVPEYAPMLGLTERMAGNTEKTPFELLSSINDNATPSLNRPVLVEIGIPEDAMQKILDHVLIGGDEYTADSSLYSGLGMDHAGRFYANDYFFGSNRVETATDILVPFAFRAWMKYLPPGAAVGTLPKIDLATGVLSALPNNGLTVHDVSYGSSTFLSDYVLAVPYDITGSDIDPSRYVANTGFNRYLTSGFKGKGQPESFSGLKQNFAGASNAY